MSSEAVDRILEEYPAKGEPSAEQVVRMVWPKLHGSSLGGYWSNSDDNRLFLGGSRGEAVQHLSIQSAIAAAAEEAKRRVLETWPEYSVMAPYSSQPYAWLSAYARLRDQGETTEPRLAQAQETLLTCPFCGRRDLRIIDVMSEDEPHRAYARVVQCRDCHARGRCNYPIGWTESDRAAREAWNDRREPQQTQGSAEIKFIVGNTETGERVYVSAEAAMSGLHECLCSCGCVPNECETEGVITTLYDAASTIAGGDDWSESFEDGSVWVKHVPQTSAEPTAAVGDGELPPLPPLIAVDHDGEEYQPQPNQFGCYYQAELIDLWADEGRRLLRESIARERELRRERNEARNACDRLEAAEAFAASRLLRAEAAEARIAELEAQVKAKEGA